MKHGFNNQQNPLPFFKCWYLRLELTFKFLIFICSTWNADIDLYIDTFSYWSRKFFIFDHPNNARFTNVHLHDLWNAKQKDGLDYPLMQKGIFSANKTNSSAYIWIKTMNSWMTISRSQEVLLVWLKIKQLLRQGGQWFLNSLNCSWIVSGSWKILKIMSF